MSSDIQLLKVSYKRYVTVNDKEEEKTYTHILPNPSSFSQTYADVDKEGSGRDSSNGLMSRERIGHYVSIDVTWDIVENSVARRNLVRILRSLPPEFTLIYKDSTCKNEKEEVQMQCYRADIKENQYLFLKDRQIWKGLATSFIQFDVTPYDDESEPTLEVE